MSHDHHRRLERMYLAAPCNRAYEPEISISDGAAEIRIEVRPEHFHAAGSLHGSVYFKVLDDAAFFAVNSLVADRFVFTVTFTIYLLRPVTEGVLTASGRVVSAGRRLFVGEAVAVDDRGREVARGSGSFMPSHVRLDQAQGYGDTEHA